MKDLYTFSKNSWHVKLFKWIYQTDPTTTFTTMCPYFWRLLLTILFLPIILIVKLFGKIGTNLLNKIESYNRNKKNKKINDLYEKCFKKDLTDKEAYYITNNYFWFDISYKLDTKMYKYIIIKSSNYSSSIVKKPSFKETKYYKYLGYIFSISIVLLIIYFISLIEFSEIDWNELKKWLIAFSIVIGIILIVFIIMVSIIYISISENETIKKPFIFIQKGVLIFFNMIYATYKQICPRITWIDENKN